MSETSPTPLPPVGFAGLGAMGTPIARRLLAADYPLTVYNRTAQKAEPLVAAGARQAPTPRALGEAATSGFVVTLLSDGKAVRRLLLGAGGAARGAGPGTLFVDLSTVAPAESRSIGEGLRARGHGFVDAPLGGSVGAAAEGRLLVFAGGSDDDVARARPLLDRFARRVEHLGPVGAGTSMKLVNNLITVGQLALVSEALALAADLGVPRERAIALLLDGGGQSRMLEAKRTELEHRKYPAQFRLALAVKDLKLMEREARATGRPLRLICEARRLYEEAVRSGFGDADFSAVLEAALARGRADPSGAAAKDPTPSPAP